MSDDLLELAQGLRVQDKTRELQGAMMRGLQFDPDAYAKAVRVSAETGVVPSAVLRDQQAFDRRMPFDPGAFVNMSSKTADWLVGNDDHAALAHDDVGVLAQIEDLGKQLALSLPRAAAGGFRALGGMAMLAGQKSGPLAFLMNPTGHQGTSDLAMGIGEDLRNYYQPLFVDPRLTPTTGAGEVGQFIGGLAGTMGKAYLAAQTGGATVPLLFGGEAFGEGAGSALEQGATPGQATLKATGSGTINAALAFIPGGKFGSEEALAQAFAQGGRMAIAKEISKGLAARAVRGTALGLGSTAAENLLSLPYAPDTPILQGWQEGVASFLGLEGAGYLGHAIRLAGESKLKARAPEAFQSAAEALLQGSGAEEVRIPGDRFQLFFQEKGLDPARMAEDLGVRNYLESITAGTDLVIPTPKALAKLSTEHLQELQPDLRLRSDLMTPREAQTYLQDGPARVAQLVEEAKSLPEGASQDFQGLKSLFQARLEATGKLTPALAEDNAALIAKGLVNLGIREGVDPFDLVKQFGLDVFGVEKGLTPVDAVLARASQDAPDAPEAPDLTAETYFQKRRPVDYAQLRARQNLSRSLSPSGQSAELTRRAMEAKAEQDAFLAWDQDVKALQAGDIHEGTQAFVQFGDHGKISIGLLEKADASSFVHELGHAWLKIQGDLAARPEASAQVKADYQALLDFAGAKDGIISPDGHEKVARAHEAYLREGNAPSPELQSTFQRFKVWLQAIYRKISQLGVNLTPEVRGVFDRLYASEAEIRGAQEQLGTDKPLFSSPEQAGMSPEQFAEYQRQHAAEGKAGESTLEAQFRAEQDRTKMQWWRDELARVRDEVAPKVDADPSQRAFRALTEGRMDDGTPIKLSKDALVKQFNAGILKELPRQGGKWVYSVKDGMDAEAAAELLGFGSGVDLVNALREVQPREMRLQAEAEAIMRDRHGDLLTDGSLAEAAMTAVHNEPRLVRMMTELRALRRKEAGTKASRTEARAFLKEIPTIQTFREASREIVDGMRIRDLDPWRYIQASRKAAGEATQALARDQFGKAADAKQREILNHHLYLESMKAKAEAQGIFRYGLQGGKDTFQGMLGKAGKDYQDQWNALAGRYEFRQVTNLELDRRTQSLAQWALAHADDGAQIDPSILLEGAPKNWREVTIPELRAVRDGLVNIETVARHQLEATLSGRRLVYEQEIAAFEEVARANNPSKPTPRTGSKLGKIEGTSSKLQGFNAYALKLEWMIDQLDGGDINGPARRNIKKPIDDAAGREKELGFQVKQKLVEAFSDMTRADRFHEFDSVGVQFPGMDRPMNRMQLFSWALNLGTAENRKVALLGEELVHPDGSMKPEALEALGKLTLKEAQRLQKVWDALEIVRPEIITRERNRTGLEPKWKELTPFVIHTADGETVSLRGGYYPLRADREVSNIGRKQDNPITLEGTFTRPGTSHSHVEHVTGATYPLLLDYPSTLGQHLSAVIKDVTAGEAISYVSKFVMHDQVASTIRETLGPAKEKEFLPWLQSFANNGIDTSQSGPVMRWLMSRRLGMVTARLAGNLTSYLVQVGDSLKLLPQENASYLLSHLPQAYLDIRRNPKAMIEEIKRLSPNEMRFREKNFNREIKDMLESKGPLDAERHRVAEFLMEGFAAMDAFQTFPSWLAKYRQGLEVHGNEAQAVAEADRLISQVFQAGEPRNLSRIMREPGAMKLFTTFQGDANTWYGILSSAFSSKDVKRISWGIMALVAEQMLTAIIRNRGPEKDKEGEWALNQAVSASLNPLGVFGDLADFGLKSAQGQFAKFNNPTLDAVEKVFTLPASVLRYQEGKHDGETLALDTVDAVGMWTGVPGTGQLIKSWRYQHGLRTGKQPTPGSTAEEIRNTLTGAPPKVKP